MAQRAVFLDRDGVLNQLVLNPSTGEYESPHALSEIELLPGAVAAARRLHEAGFVLFVVSNQPSFAKGKCALETLHAISAQIEAALAAGGAPIARGYYCHHHPQGIIPAYAKVCECRKPAPGALLSAAREFEIDLRSSWMIGDQETDVGCGRAAGCRTVLVANPLSAHKRPGIEQPTLRATSLPDAVEQLLRATGAPAAAPGRSTP